MIQEGQMDTGISIGLRWLAYLELVTSIFTKGCDEGILLLQPFYEQANKCFAYIVSSSPLSWPQSIILGRGVHFQTRH